MTALVPAGPPNEQDIRDLHTRARELDVLLHARSAEVSRLDAELSAFAVRYRQQVGRLHEQLDELESAIAEAELGEINRRVEAEGAGPTTSRAGRRHEPAPRFTSDAVRTLFRDVAKAVHPDLARDAHARERRHRLMVEANRAYALGDEQRLRAILRTWERSPEAVQGDDPDAARLRLVRRIEEIETQLAAYAGDLAELQDSPIWKLKAMVDEAATRGKDLVGDMVKRLTRDIMVARNRLDAMRTRGDPRGPARR